MSNQDDKDTLIDEMRKMPLVGGDDYYEALYVLVESHLKQKIRNATLDEVKEAYEYEANMQGLPQEVFNAIGKAIDNLRGNDE